MFQTELLENLESEFQSVFSPYTLHKKLQEYGYSSFYNSPKETCYLPGPFFGSLIELWEECFYIAKDAPSSNNYDYLIRRTWQVKTQAEVNNGAFGNTRFSQEESVWEVGLINEGKMGFFRVRDFNMACEYVLAYVKSKEDRK